MWDRSGTSLPFARKAANAGFQTRQWWTLCWTCCGRDVGLRESQEAELIPFLKILKQKSAYRLKRRTAARLWQKKYYDLVLRESDPWEAVARYVWMNPVRAGLCARPQDWALSGSFKVHWHALLASPDDAWIPPWKQR